MLTSPFDAPRDYGRHEGVDYDIPGEPADSKEPVLCLYDGVVTWAGNKGTAYGYYVIVRSVHNGSGFYVWYCHMDTTAVATGASITKGQPVGELGSTGGPWAEHIHINLQVPGYGLAGYVVPDVVDPHPYIEQNPPPPPAQAVDLTRYIEVVASGNGPFYVLQHSDGRTEDIQHQVVSGVVYVVKNTQWEQMRVAGGYVWRRIDTSPGNDQYYKLHDTGADWAKWIPSTWEIGRQYEGRPFVRFFRKNDCQPVTADQQTTDYFRFATHHVSWTSPAGITLQNVAEIHWSKSPNGQVLEKYFYAKGVGLVRWESSDGRYSYISELPQGRPPLVREVIPCLV